MVSSAKYAPQWQWSNLNMMFYENIHALQGECGHRSKKGKRLMWDSAKEKWAEVVGHVGSPRRSRWATEGAENRQTIPMNVANMFWCAAIFVCASQTSFIRGFVSSVIVDNVNISTLTTAVCLSCIPADHSKIAIISSNAQLPIRAMLDGGLLYVDINSITSCHRENSDNDH